jgi:hypothetical protein
MTTPSTARIEALRPRKATLAPLREGTATCPRPTPPAILQSLVDAQATAHIGAELHERSDARTTRCNGSRRRPSLPPVVT